jgi:hypothetical protein
MEQRGIHAGEAGEHLGVAPVALALGAGDVVELARVGHQHGGALFGKVTTNPRTMRARLQRDGGAGKIREELRQGRAGVGQRSLADNVAGGREDTDVMLAITEIDAEGEPAADRSGRGGHDGGSRTGFSYVSFHRQTIAPTHHCVGSLPSHLILLGGNFSTTK